MRALQLHYTSCRRGQSGSPGFQTRALSDGIRPDEQREIERLGLYQPPRDASPQPDDAAIRAEFPRAFRFETLGSGRQVLLLSAYAGQDYSGRWGNYFAHALVLEGPLNDRWPIDLYEWEGWRSRLDRQEDTEEIPGPLPPVDVSTIPAAASFTLDELRQFLSEESGRTEKLARMLRAVLLRRESPRTVLIRDTEMEGLFWIACIQKAFPPTHQSELSFSTYQFDPRSCFAVNATSGATDFVLNENERRFQFFLFDQVGTVESDVPGTPGDLADILSGWMAARPERLASFHEFSRAFRHDRIEPDLIHVVRFFQFSTEERPPVSSEKLIAMLSFAESHAREAGRRTLLEAGSRVLAGLGSSGAPEEYQAVTRFLLRGATASGHRDDVTLVASAYIRMFDACVFERGIGIDVVRATRTEIERTLGSSSQALAEALLDAERLSRAVQRLDTLEPSGCAAFWNDLISALRALRRDPIASQPEILGVLGAIAAASTERLSGLDWLFRDLGGDPEALRVAALALAARIEERRDRENAQARIQSVGRALERVLSSLPEITRETVRAGFDNEHGWNLLLGGWAEILSSSTNPEKAYSDYEDRVLSRMPQFAAAHRASVARMLLEHSNRDVRARLAQEWIERGTIDKFPLEFAKTVLRQAAQGVSLDPGHRRSDEWARWIQQSKARLGVRLQPDRLLLRTVLTTAREGKAIPVEESFQDLPDALLGVDANEYAEFLGYFLAPTLDNAKTPRLHGAILAAAFVPGLVIVFRGSYRSFCQAKHVQGLSSGQRAALLFWLDPTSTAKEFREIEVLREAALNDLAGLLVALGAKTVARVAESLVSEHLKEPVRDAWNRMQRDIETSLSHKPGWLPGSIRK